MKRTPVSLSYDIEYLDIVCLDEELWCDRDFVYVYDKVTGIAWTAVHRFDVIDYLADE